MKTILKKIWASLDNSPAGFSARKLAAFTAIMGVAVIITHRYTTPENLPEVLLLWLSFALLCLGIVTAEQIIRFREGNRSTTKTESEAPQ